MDNTAEILSTSQVLVTEVTAQVIEITTPASPAVVEVATVGPQAAAYIGQLEDVNTTGRVDGSVLVYDEEESKWVGNNINTVVTLTDGGNF